MGHDQMDTIYHVPGPGPRPGTRVCVEGDIPGWDIGDRVGFGGGFQRAIQIVYCTI